MRFQSKLRHMTKKIRYIGLFLLILFFGQISMAQDTFDSYSDNSASGEVIYEKQKDLTLSYKDRRSTLGILFSINYENILPKDYISAISTKTYEAMMGSDAIKIAGAEFGVKYNFELGSLTGLVGYGMGSTSNEGSGVKDLKLSILKFDLNYAMDNLFDEPYVAPFGQIGAHQMIWTENSSDGSVYKEENTTLSWNYHFKVGLSFQLNWIEKAIDQNSPSESLRSSGLENTYLDIFYTSYAEPASVATTAGQEGDPNLKSDELGAGLKMEF